MKTVRLIRTSKNDVAIYGILLVKDGNVVDFVCKTIERLDKSFPVGTYPLVFEYSERFKVNLWELKDIAGRGEIKIHSANYWNQLEGCIGLGKVHQDINHDGVIDVAQSKIALDEFMISMIKQKESTITVTEV